MTLSEAKIAQQYYNQGLLDGYEDGHNAATKLAYDRAVDGQFVAWLKGVGCASAALIITYLISHGV